MTCKARAFALPVLVISLGSGCSLLQPKPKQRGTSGGQTEPAARSEPQPANDGQRFALDPRYLPLTEIVERPAMPGASNVSATTISPTVYVPDLQRWLEKRPPGSVMFESVLRHEQVHAKRQEAYGVDPWVKRYLNDAAFMWAEEQAGWYEEIKHMGYGGLKRSAEDLAKILSGYQNLKGSMVSYAEALAWARQVLDGSWRPPN